MRKRPKTVILHIGTNDCIDNNSVQIIEKLLSPKEFILSKLPDSEVISSTLIERVDHANARLTVVKTNEQLFRLGLDLIDNTNITDGYLGRKGLHFTQHGTGKLAVNIVKCIKRL